MNRSDKIRLLARAFESNSGKFLTNAQAKEEAKELLDIIFPPLEPIEHDKSYDRTYIPMPGGYEVQTKGKGSTFRIANQEDRMAFGPTRFEHDFLTEMANKMREAYGE